MTVPISPLSFHQCTISRGPQPASNSLVDSLEDDRLAAATQLALRNAQISAGIVVFVSNVPSEPNRTYVIDVAGGSHNRSQYTSIADRLASAFSPHASAVTIQHFFETIMAEQCSRNGGSPEQAAFTITSAEMGSMICLLQACSENLDWRARTEEHLQIVAPLLGELAKAERTKMRASRRLGLLESALDEMSVAMFMLNAQARPFCLNAAAFGRLAMADAFRLTRDGVLSCINTRDTLALHEAVRRTNDVPVADMREEPLLITMRDGERAMATLRSVSAEGAGSDNRAALLMVQHEVSLSRAALDALGLTASEQRFLSTFLYCSSLTAAAERLNLSEETARTYLKRICAKIGVRKQAELVALIWNLSLPLRQKPDTISFAAPGALGRLNCCQRLTR